VQPFASSQFGGGPPMQAPAAQVSPVVQALPSSQVAVLFENTHPVDVLHVSVVHGFESLQVGGAPPAHDPAAQVSFVVQAFPSLHAVVLFVKTQPVDGLQVSVVHTLLSLHTLAPSGWQLPPPQVSPVVQASPSLHGAVLFVNTQPVDVLQVSVVHTLLSLHTTAPPG